MIKIFSFILALWGLTSLSWSQVNVGVSVGTGGDSFHLAIGSYYHAPPEQVAVCQQRQIPDEEQPVVFFVAQRAHVAPGVIINLRAGGMPWAAIFNRYRLSPRVLYVPIHGSVVGTPYAGFYAYYRGGRRVRLMDADIVNMVNLRFASDYYHRPAEEIIQMRAGGRNYAYIHDHYGHPSGAPRDRKDEHRDRHRDGDWR